MHTTPWIALGNDKYFDDNSLAVVTLVDCGNNTGNWRYLDRAWEVFDRFVRTGLGLSKRRSRRTRSGRTDPTKPNTTDRAGSATALAALAAFRLAEYYPQGRNGFDKNATVEWGLVRRSIGSGTSCVTRPSNLLWNSLQDKDGAWPADKTKWTYLPGLTIRGYVAALPHHRRQYEPEPGDARLVTPAIDRNGAIFDGLVTDPNRRFWSDATFFTSILAGDGLLELYRVTDDLRYWEEMRRNANYMYWYLNDTTACTSATCACGRSTTRTRRSG